MNKLSEIEIQYISEAIPSILQKKFNSKRILNLQQVLDIDITEFKKIKGIGKSVVNKLIAFQELILNNSDILYEIHDRNSKQYILPIDFDSLNQFSLIELINESVIDYLNLYNNKIQTGILNHYYGFSNSKVFTLEEISNYFSKTRERIRQIKELLLIDIDTFLSGNLNIKLRCSCKKEICESYKELKFKVLKQGILSKELFTEILSNEYGYNNKYPESIDLLIDLLNLTICGKAETSFTNAEIIIPPKIDKKNFLKTAEIVLRTLKAELSPLNEMQLIINCKKKNKKILNLNILKAVQILPEIELIQSGETYLYQVKFEFLSNASDRAYRILLENGDTMYIDDIVSEINRRLVHSNVPKIYDRYSLHLASDNRFMSQGKTGNWNIKIWGKNSVQIDLLIKRALYKLNKPSTYEDIFSEVVKERKNLKEKSVRAIVGRDCLKVENDKWILPEWKQKYNHLAFLKRKKRAVTSEPEHRIEQRLRITEYLKNKQDYSSLGSEIINALKSYDKSYTRISFYIIFEQEEHFNKYKKGNRIYVSLRQTAKNEKLAIDQYNWQTLKMKIERDIMDFFADPTSPSYSFNLIKAIEVFYKLINHNTGVLEFNGLNQRILGNLNKYYLNASDRTDKLNFLKQFLTCLDPLLKKILYLISSSDYKSVISNKKGLGVIFEKLDKLDPTEERYKDSRTARKFRFGKHIQTVYHYRNSDTHSANDWTELQIANVITSCLVVYIFACSEYYEEIEKEIT